MGGGGVNGEVAFPPYIERSHSNLIQGEEADQYGDSLVPDIEGGAKWHMIDALSYLLQNNPFDEEEYTDTDNFFVASSTRWRQHDSLIRSMSHEGDWCSAIKEAAEKVDDCIVSDIDTQEIIDEAFDDAAEMVTELFGALDSDTQTGIVVETDWDSYVDNAVAKVDEAGVLNDIDFTTVKSDAASEISTAMAAIKAEDSTGLSAPDTDWAAYIDAAVSKADTAGVLNEIDTSAIITAAVSGADTEIAAAIAAAVDAANDSVIDDLTTEYENRAEKVRANRVRSYVAGMMDANAVHGSAFLIGLALIDRQHIQDVDMFHAEISKDAFLEAMRLHVQSYLGQVRAELEADILEKRNRDQMLLQGAQEMRALLVNRSQYEQTLIRVGFQVYGALIQAGLTAEQADKAAREALLRQGVQNMLTLLGQKKQYEGLILELFAQGFARSTQAHLNGTVVSKQTRDQLVSQGVREMMTMLQTRVQLDNSAVSLWTEINRMRAVNLREYEAAEFDRGARQGVWGLKGFERAANVISGPAGMAAALPEGPSKAQAALGGALSGAASGAMIGSVGGPPGTAIGAGIGGLLGGIGGALS